MSNNLVSKIATAYNSMGTVQRDQASGTDAEEIQNPELDRAFDAMVESNKAERARSTAVVLPLRPPTAPTQTEATQESREELDYACPECGHRYADDDSFCARCGALLQESTALKVSNTQEPDSSVEPRVVQHSYSCHCGHDWKQTYLLLSIVLLLTFIAWQLWQQSHPFPTRTDVTVPAAPVVQPAQLPKPPAVSLPALTSAHAPIRGADRSSQQKIDRPQRPSTPRQDEDEAEPEVVWHIPPKEAAQQ